MENCTLLNSLKNQFFVSFIMLEKIIDICPDELWNKKVSGFVFWQQLFHTLAVEQYFFKEGNTEFLEAEPFKGKEFYPHRMEKDPEDILSKDVLKKFCNETKETAEIFFNEKDDNWLKLSFSLYDKVTNHEAILTQIRHIMYHVGHSEAIFRENGNKVGEYLDW